MKPFSLRSGSWLSNVEARSRMCSSEAFSAAARKISFLRLTSFWARVYNELLIWFASVLAASSSGWACSLIRMVKIFFKKWYISGELSWKRKRLSCRIYRSARL